MFQCPECAKTFKSKSGLRRHIKGQHPIDEAPPHEEMVTEDQDAADLTLAEIIEDDEKALKKALKALGIKREDVMSYKVYPHKVAIIQGPTGWKKVWRREDPS